MRTRSLKALPIYSSKWCIVLQTDSYNLQNIAVTKFPKSYYSFGLLVLSIQKLHFLIRQGTPQDKKHLDNLCFYLKTPLCCLLIKHYPPSLLPFLWEHTSVPIKHTLVSFFACVLEEFLERRAGVTSIATEFASSSVSHSEWPLFPLSSGSDSDSSSSPSASSSSSSSSSEFESEFEPPPPKFNEKN